MGIKDFFKVKVNDSTIAELGKPIKLEDLRNKKICIDASYVIYNSVLAMPDINFLTDKKGRSTTHIKVILNKVLQLAKFGIHQLWIFESAIKNPLKFKTLEKRRIARLNSKKSFVLTSEHINEIKELLQYLGIPYIQAPDEIENEQYAAFLTSPFCGKKQPFCDYVLSGDSDVLIYAGNLLRPCKNNKLKTNYCTYELTSLLEKMGITLEQLRIMAVLLGTDFNEKTKGIGPKRVLSRVINGQYQLNEEQIKILEFFNKPIESCETKLISNKYNEEKVLAFLEERNFNIDNISKILKVLK